MLIMNYFVTSAQDYRIFSWNAYKIDTTIKKSTNVISTSKIPNIPRNLSIVKYRCKTKWHLTAIVCTYRGKKLLYLTTIFTIPSQDFVDRIQSNLLHNSAVTILQSTDDCMIVYNSKRKLYSVLIIDVNQGLLYIRYSQTLKTEKQHVIES